MIEFGIETTKPRPRFRLKDNRFVWGILLKRFERDGICPAMVEVKWFNPPPENEAGFVETVLWEHDILLMPDFSDLPTIPELADRPDLALPRRLDKETDAAFFERTKELRQKRTAFLAQRMEILQTVVAEMNRRSGLSHDVFLDEARAHLRQGLEGLVAAGVFDGLNEKGEPLAPPQRFSIAELGARATMADIMVALKVFPSLKQARNNGWDKPLVLGIQEVTKKRLRIEIVP